MMCRKGVVVKLVKVLRFLGIWTEITVAAILILAFVYGLIQLGFLLSSYHPLLVVLMIAAIFSLIFTVAVMDENGQL